MQTRRPWILVLVLALIGCKSSDESASPAAAEVAAVQPELAGQPLDAAPADWSVGLDQAAGAMRALGGRLRERLGAEMKAGGPPQAIAVCRDEARALTVAQASESQVELGRTSHRLRNPANAAPDWLVVYLSQVQELPAAEVRPRAFDLGDRVGLVKPIATAEVCTRCHGATGTLAPEVQAVLIESYPADQATGFSPGDLRGLFWATAPKAAGALNP